MCVIVKVIKSWLLKVQVDYLEMICWTIKLHQGCGPVQFILPSFIAMQHKPSGMRQPNSIISTRVCGSKFRTN